MTTKDQIREQQRDTWNKFSVGWKKHDELVFNWLKPVGDKLIDQAKIRDGDRVLDAATGTGEPGLTAAQKIKNAKVVGSDVAADMLKIAETKASLKGIKNYEVKLCSESSLPFPDDHFDAVMCRFGIMYFPDPDAAVREMSRVLKAGRTVAMSAWAEPSKNTWATTATSVVNRVLSLQAPSPDAPGLFRFSKNEGLPDLLANAGLKNITASEVQGTLRFNSADAYWEFITDVVAPVAVALSKVTIEQRAKVKQDVIEAAKERAAGNGIPFTWSAWVVSGSK